MSPYTDAVDAHRTAAEIIDAQMRERMAAARDMEEGRDEWRETGETVTCKPDPDAWGDANVDAWRVAWKASQAELAAAQAELVRREQVWEDRHNTQLAQVKALQEMVEFQRKATGVFNETIARLEAERDEAQAWEKSFHEALDDAHEIALDSALAAYVSTQPSPHWARQSRAYRAIEALRRGDGKAYLVPVSRENDMGAFDGANGINLYHTDSAPDCGKGAYFGLTGKLTNTPPDPDGWIEWTGEGEPPSGMVEYRRRAFIGVESDRSDFLTWAHTGGARDIIAYRPASPQPGPINRDLARAKRDEPRPITEAMVEAACIECPFVGPEGMRAALEAAERAR